MKKKKKKKRSTHSCHPQERHRTGNPTHTHTNIDRRRLGLRPHGSHCMLLFMCAGVSRAPLSPRAAADVHISRRPHSCIYCVPVRVRVPAPRPRAACERSRPPRSVAASRPARRRPRGRTRRRARDDAAQYTVLFSTFFVVVNGWWAGWGKKGTRGSGAVHLRERSTRARLFRRAARHGERAHGPRDDAGRRCSGDV